MKNQRVIKLSEKEFETILEYNKLLLYIGDKSGHDPSNYCGTDITTEKINAKDTLDGNKTNILTCVFLA